MTDDPKLLPELVAACRTRWLSGKGRNWLQGLLERRNKSRFFLPPAGRIPADFIRQEPWEIEYLYSVARHARKGILEVGRFNGGSALIFAAANRQVPIWSIDIAPKDDERLMRLCADLQIGANLDLIVGDSQHTRYERIAEYDLLFIDGDHSFAGCLADLENWWPGLSRGGHVLLHDCYLGNPVQDAVIDFVARHDVVFVQAPWRGARHYRDPAGSMCHLVKA